MTTRRFPFLAIVLAAVAIGACTATPAGSASAVVAGSPAASLPADFPLGTWTSTITAEDLRTGGITAAAGIQENSGLITLAMKADGTWTQTQQSSDPLRRPVFQGTWRATGPDTFEQTTTFPSDYAGDVVKFGWKLEDGALRLTVLTPPDEILPVIMEAHPWQRTP